MLSVSFLGATIVDTLLNVLATIAIVVVGAFVIVFLSDLVISIIDGKNGIFFKREKNDSKKYGNDLPERPKMTNRVLEEPKETEYVKPTKEEKISYGNVDLEEAEKEEEVLAKKAKEEASKQQDEEIKDEDADYDFSSYNNLSKQGSASVIAPVVATPVQDEQEDEEENDDNEKYIQEISKRAMELLDEQEDEEEIKVLKSVVEKTEIDEEDAIKTLTAQLEEQKAIYAKLLAEKEEEDKQKYSIEEQNRKLQEEKVALEKALEEQKAQEEKVEAVTVVAGPSENLDELTAKLAVLEERLKANEKLFKANKKEFVPLFKINKSLENDTKKLRRKEASVAKQKVMLYGVNNYVDIDPEKAKELTEELDLLDGLRLSVKHCEDVMAANKDRYPILEQTNKILAKTIEDIKSDIAEVNAKIETVKNAQDNQ